MKEYKQNIIIMDNQGCIMMEASEIELIVVRILHKKSQNQLLSFKHFSSVQRLADIKFTIVQSGGTFLYIFSITIDFWKLPP
jgi:hypothetical protein